MKILKRILKLIFKTILFIILVVLAIIIVSNTLILTKDYTLSFENLPKSFDGYKIAQVSDLHSKEFLKENSFLVRQIDKESPDIVVFTGDMISTKDQNFDVFYSFAGKIAKKYKVYYIVGNHEQNLSEKRLDEFLKRLENIGIIVLDNNKVVISRGDESINLYGMWFNLRYYKDANDERTTQYHFGLEQMEKVLGNCEKDSFNILLTHNPLYFETYSNWGADVTLSGHIHGGMIRVPFKGGLLSPEKEFFPQYDAGVFYDYGNSLVVNRGLGNGEFPIRFLNCPEVSIIKLESLK